MKKLTVALILVPSSLVLIVGVLYWWLRSPIPSEADIVGSYSGAEFGYLDQLEIIPANKFVQTLTKPNGEIVKNAGTWRLENRVLLVSGYLCFIDSETNTALANPNPYSSFPFVAYPDMLIWDWGSGFYRLDKK